MTKVKVLGGFFLIAFFMGCIMFLVCLILTDSVNKNMTIQMNDYGSVSDSFIDLLGDSMGEEKPKNENRLSQQVAVVSGEDAFRESGTITKVRDPYYPGTYRINFSERTILTNRAKVVVTMDVKAGEKVHVLLGDKEKGYTEYLTVMATEDGKAAFYTNILQDYTLSTTDICAAQKSVESMLSITMAY